MESVCVGRRGFRRQALYLDGLNGPQRAEWRNAAEAFNEKNRVRQLKFFPADRVSPGPVTSGWYGASWTSCRCGTFATGARFR